MKPAFVLIGIIIIFILSYFFYFGDNEKKDNPVYVNYIEAKKTQFVSSISSTGKIISKRKEIVKSVGSNSQ